MTEKTAEIQRFDYSKPPPGYRISGPPSHHEHTQSAIRDAWINYKTDNDPPGGEIVGHASGWAFGFLEQENEAIGSYHMHYEARAAAWVWHDRRHLLVEALVRDGVPADLLWPRALLWSDARCDDVQGINAISKERLLELTRILAVRHG